MMRKKYNKIKLRAALLSLLTIALLAATAAFIGTSAANAVSDSDLAASGSDLAALTDEIPKANEIPADLGEPKIVMTTSKAVGEEIGFGLNISNAYVDLGGGNIVMCSGIQDCEGDTYYYDNMLAGNTVKIYSTEDITHLFCLNNNLTTLDLSKNTSLIFLNCNDNNLTALDVSNNTALSWLDCCHNNLTALDLSNNTALTWFDCVCNNLTALDVSGCTALDLLNCESNNLTALDVSNCTALRSLMCDSNNLTVLDVSNCTALQSLYCFDNNLTTLDVSKNTALTELLCHNNSLKFSTMKISSPEPVYFSYLPQADVEIAASVKANETIDLSSEYETTGELTFRYHDENYMWFTEKSNGGKTVYKWFDSSDNEVTPTKSENGVFTFGDEFVGKTLYCTMTNALFPDLTLKTTNVEIKEADFIVEDNVGVVEDVEPSDGIIIRDEDGNIIDLKGVKLIVGNIETNKKKTVLEAIERYNKEFKADSTDCALYDISLVDKNGAKVYIEDGGRIKIKLKYPDNLGRESEDYTYHLYHQKEDGSIEEIAINCEPNGIWFYADEFSPYALTWSLKSSDGTTDTGKGPATGESIALTIVASCLAMLSLAAIGAVIYRKKFARSAK